MDTKMQTQLETIIARFGADTGSVHVVEDGMLRLTAQVGLPQEMLRIVGNIPMGKGMAGMAAERNEPVSSCNLQTETRSDIPKGAKKAGVNGAIVVPLRDAAGNACGALGIGVHRDYEYTAEEIAQLLDEGQRMVGDSGEHG